MKLVGPVMRLENAMDVEKLDGGLSWLTDVLGCVLTYEVLRTPGAHGQTIGADGTGTFAEICLGDPEEAAAEATKRIRDLEARGWRFGAVYLVQHGDIYGWSGSPVRIVPPNAEITGG